MAPIRFVFGLHLHQPVGNFDHVFADHVRDVYRPVLEHLSSRDFFPAVLHLSGPLLDWLEEHDASYLDLLGRLVADRRIEPLLAGYYEPVLASLPRADRVEQIQWMRDAIQRRFGVDARGLWLTERVWEPELATDLADAGVRYALVDDRHFLVSGFSSEQLHAPYWTESGGKRVALFPIDERLRYLIPFRPPAETADYLRSLREAGQRLAVFADDAEKFGGWPGTHDWVYGKGWLHRFMETVGGQIERGEVQLGTLSEALEVVPSGGIAYLPTASYREMEGWSLPPEPARRLIQLERDLGPERVAGPDGALIRGSHWRNFLVKYPEANRMHKKMQALSLLCRRRGDPGSARRAIGRAQCNDAYWHGVFGGLYLPHLREAIWQNLARAEAELRRGEDLEAEVLDLDGDGHNEVWIHSDQFSALLSPGRGGAIEEYIVFVGGINYANTLTRRREPYHGTDPGDNAEVPFDAEPRALLVDRILPGGLGLEAYAAGDYWPVRTWADTACSFSIQQSADQVEIVCSFPGPGGFDAMEKRLSFGRDGGLGVAYRWDPNMGSPDDVFAPELSLASRIELRTEPASDNWTFPIETIAKSERGLDRTRQGESVTLRWPVTLGEGSVELAPASSLQYTSSAPGHSPATASDLAPITRQ